VCAQRKPAGGIELAVISRLLQPLDYLRIEHPAKRKYDYIVPLAIAIPVSAWFTFAPMRPSIFGHTGLLAGINGLLQILTGFYIASLAAIATFNKRSMDLPMSGDPPRLDTIERGIHLTIELTRRRFLCMMFGYLAFLSLSLYLIGIWAILSVDSIKAIFPFSWYSPLRNLFVLSYLVIFSNMIVTTLLGLYYMADRIHRHDSRDIAPDEIADADAEEKVRPPDPKEC
jgi:hypothetical protein